MPPQVRELPEPNPVTRRKHQREVLWQITAPLVVGLLLLVGMVALLGFNAVVPVSQWAELSTIFLIIPLLILSLVPLALIGTLIYLTIILIPNIPPYARLAQDAIRKVAGYAKQGADMAAEPIILVESLTARLRSLLGKK